VIRRRHPVSLARLNARRRLFIHVTGVGVWGSGVLWLVFHYFVSRPGEFGPEHSPLEPWWLKLHGAFAFLALWTAGLLWGLHVVNGWRLKRRRWSGSLAFGLMLVLIASGYLLYYVGDDSLRALTSAAHWAIGLALPAVYIVHRLAGRFTDAAGD
jgi:hypothetical protein